MKGGAAAMALTALAACSGGSADEPATTDAAPAGDVVTRTVQDKCRTVITTDGEVDDRDSVIRALLYANEMDIAGIVLTSSSTPTRRSTPTSASTPRVIPSRPSCARTPRSATSPTRARWKRSPRAASF